jgi:putative cardiolipin synthase
LDPRAVVHNTEIGTVIDSPEIAEGMAQWFDRNIDKMAFRLELYKDYHGKERIRWHGQVDGRRQAFTRDPFVSYWRILGLSVIGLLPIESQL